MKFSQNVFKQRDGPGGGAYFVAYEWVKEAMRKYYGPTSKVTESVIAGGLAGNSYICLPFMTKIKKCLLTAFCFFFFVGTSNWYVRSVILQIN